VVRASLYSSALGLLYWRGAVLFQNLLQPFGGVEEPGSFLFDFFGTRAAVVMPSGSCLFVFFGTPKDLKAMFCSFLFVFFGLDLVDWRSAVNASLSSSAICLVYWRCAVRVSSLFQHSA
jgi:hypothetical protein